MAENNQQLQIELKPEVAEGIYSNLAILTHSSSEFVADFVQMMPGMQKAQVRSRIIMAPEHAKRLLAALQDNVQKYEQQFGTIKLPQPQSNEGRTIAPFNLKQGDA
ncbi:MAG: DUF3467 domain-containing protein [Bacteroidaceae bacterium]|nr:DUF3467 domain-containing protein [Bacteroidaceae bacterium]